MELPDGVQAALQSDCVNAELFAFAALIVAACGLPPPPESPTSTVGSPTWIIPPCAVASMIRTTGFPIARTVNDPITVESGGPTQISISPTTDTGSPPASTVGAPGPTTGPPTCGIGTTAGVCIGQMCMLPTHATGAVMQGICGRRRVPSSACPDPPGYRILRAMPTLLQYQLTTVNAVRRIAASGRLFAVLDACDEPRVPPKASELAERATPLYQGKSQDRLWAIAPYLAQVDSALLDWIAASLWSTPWGIFLVTDATLDTLRSHLRRFLLVDAPDGGQWYFRFYDPRVLARYLPTCDATQLADFFGPVTTLGWVNLADYGVMLAGQQRFDAGPSDHPRVRYRKAAR